MFERFTDRARQVVVLAQDEARGLRHNYIGTEHLLLGLMGVEDGLAVRVLESFGIVLEEARACVARIVGQGDEPVTEQIPFTPRAKKVLELALRESLTLGHNYIGTEHLLLALLREHEGRAVEILDDFHASPEKIRDEIIRMLSGVVRAPEGGGVFGRFTERARQVVVLAQDEARALKHNYIGTEHLLLGLLREEEGVAARVLGSLGVTLVGVRTRVLRIVGEGDEPATGQILFTKHAINVTNLVQREARSLGHNYIGTEHILLALVRENESVAARILLDFPADAEKLREEIIRVIEGPDPRQTDESFPPGAESAIELVLRRVVPVAQQVSDGTWVVSIEVWDHGLVVRWATSERWPLRAPELHGWRVSDDVGTSYAQVVGSGGGSPQRGFRFHAEFAPAPPPETTSLRIRREATGDDLSISLTD